MPAEEKPANVPADTVRSTLEHTAETFARLAASAHRMGDPEQAKRLDALAERARERAQRLLHTRRDIAELSRPQPTPTARVLLVDDHDLAREALRSVLAAVPGFDVVAEAANGQEALRLARALSPDLVLMDVRMPGMDGVEATRQLLSQQPRTKVVILTSLDHRHTVLEALRAGAAGYLLKGASKQEIVATLHAVLSGERRVQGSLAADLLTEDAAGTSESTVGTVTAISSLLSAREREILQLLAQGRTNQAIGQELCLSVNTVKTHVQHILHKLEAPDRAAAVARGAALGLIGVGSPSRT